MSGANVISDTQAQQDFVAAIQLLKNDALRTFRIEIETDSTIAVNENVEKQSRIEFLSAISQFLPQALSTFSKSHSLGKQWPKCFSSVFADSAPVEVGICY